MTCVFWLPPSLDHLHIPFPPNSSLCTFLSVISSSPQQKYLDPTFPNRSNHFLVTMQLLCLTFLLHLFTFASATLTYLNLTAISASNGASVLECWQLSAPFVISNQAGTVGAATAQLGNVANASFSVLPAKFDGGAHRAPAVQYVFLQTCSALPSKIQRH